MMTHRMKMSLRMSEMYSWEIEDYFKKRDMTITHTDLSRIRGESPQIRRITFMGYGEEYSKYRVLTYDGYWWELSIKNFS